jgi:hypothetical protein
MCETLEFREIILSYTVRSGLRIGVRVLTYSSRTAGHRPLTIYLWFLTSSNVGLKLRRQDKSRPCIHRGSQKRDITARKRRIRREADEENPENIEKR